MISIYWKPDYSLFFPIIIYVSVLLQAVAILTNILNIPSEEVSSTVSPKYSYCIYCYWSLTLLFSSHNLYRRRQWNKNDLLLASNWLEHSLLLSVYLVLWYCVLPILLFIFYFLNGRDFCVCVVHLMGHRYFMILWKITTFFWIIKFPCIPFLLSFVRWCTGCCLLTLLAYVWGKSMHLCGLPLLQHPNCRLQCHCNYEYVEKCCPWIGKESHKDYVL